MAQSNQRGKTSLYISIFISVLLACFGLFVLTHKVEAEDLHFWVPALLILGGVMLISSFNPQKSDGTPSPTRGGVVVAAGSLILVGVFIILRQAGVISLPWLQYIVGFGLIGFGLYGCLNSISALSKTSASSSDDQ